MYLRRVWRGRDARYVLRESVEAGGRLTHRDLCDLGSDPASWIEYPGGNGFYFRPELEEALAAAGARYTTSDIEELFSPFIEPHIRRIIGAFGHRRPAPRAPGSREDFLARQRALHPFDKRRLHYLRCGRVDTGNLDAAPLPFMRVLFGKSRDEAECVIEEMERVLKPHEGRSYLYTAFHIQSHFPGHLLRNRPGALDPERLDACFLEEVCRLNADPAYSGGAWEGDRLSPLLSRYVVLWFDAAPDAVAGWAEYAEDMRRNAFVRPPGAPPMPLHEACACLGLTPEEFSRMGKRDLAHCFRRRAKALHPDHGGDHEGFLRASRAYERLRAMKG